MGDFLVGKCQEMVAELESKSKAEKRVEELVEGLRETMDLFKEREESFDGLARINKEQERKVLLTSQIWHKSSSKN